MFTSKFKTKLQIFWINKALPLCSLQKSALNQHKAICCNHCSQWVHIKCNDLIDLDYNLLKSINEFLYCILCPSEVLSFCTVNSIMPLPKGKLNKPTGKLISLINHFYNFTDDGKENKFKLPSCKYINRCKYL